MLWIKELYFTISLCVELLIIEGLALLDRKNTHERRPLAVIKIETSYIIDPYNSSRGETMSSGIHLASALYRLGLDQ